MYLEVLALKWCALHNEVLLCPYNLIDWLIGLIDWLIVGTAVISTRFSQKSVKLHRMVWRLQFISYNSKTGHHSGEIAIAKVL